MEKLLPYKTKTLKVRDKITGFEGMVTGHSDYITGCDQYLVQPPVKETEFKEPRWFDANRLEVVEETPALKVTGEENGADIPAPAK